MPRRQRREHYEKRSPREIPFEPARNPAAREKQLIGLAVNLAERQLYDGTASPSVLTHYLKLASTREEVERDILERKKVLLEAKAESINTNKHVEELYTNAIDAMSKYSPTKDE